MNMFTKPTLHTKADGSKYMLDVAEFTLQEGKVNTIIMLFNEVAHTLTKYKDTKDRAKNPDYLRGVLKRRKDYIEESRASEIYESLKNFPLGERAKSKLVADSIDEIDEELYRELSRYEAQLEFYRRDMIKGISIDNDLIITANEEQCSVYIREGFIDELRTSMIREISQSDLEDNETFRKAIHLLWSLAEKGYSLTEQLSITGDGQPIVIPSVVDRLMRSTAVTNKEGRELLISDERLFNELHRQSNFNSY